MVAEKSLTFTVAGQCRIRTDFPFKQIARNLHLLLHAIQLVRKFTKILYSLANHCKVLYVQSQFMLKNTNYFKIIPCKWMHRILGFPHVTLSIALIAFCKMIIKLFLIKKYKNYIIRRLIKVV